MTSHSPEWNAGYAIGYDNGESSVTADIECFIQEELGMDTGDGWAKPLREMKARLDALEEREEDRRQAALEARFYD